jgi:hypothetical protein
MILLIPILLTKFSPPSNSPINKRVKESMEPQPVIEPAKPNHIPLILLSLLLIFSLATNAYLLYQNRQWTTHNCGPDFNQNPSTENASASPSADPTTDWQEYSTDSFSFKYPPSHTLASTVPGGEAPNPGSLLLTGSSKANNIGLETLPYIGDLDSFIASNVVDDSVRIFDTNWRLGQLIRRERLANGLDVARYQENSTYSMIFVQNGTALLLHTHIADLDLIRQILSTFKFTDTDNQ